MSDRRMIREALCLKTAMYESELIIFDNLNNVLIFQNVIFADFLRIVFG